MAKPSTKNKIDSYGSDKVFELISECKTLQVIANDIGVSKGSLLVWLALKPDQYARAREAQAEKLVEDILTIADEADVETKYDGEDVTLDLSNTAVQRNRLRIDARKWLAGKMAPKKYGEKVTTELTGSVQVATVDLKGLSDTELEQMQTLLAKAAK